MVIRFGCFEFRGIGVVFGDIWWVGIFNFICDRFCLLVWVVLLKWVSLLIEDSDDFLVVWVWLEVLESFELLLEVMVGDLYVEFVVCGLMVCICWKEFCMVDFVEFMLIFCMSLGVGWGIVELLGWFVLVGSLNFVVNVNVDFLLGMVVLFMVLLCSLVSWCEMISLSLFLLCCLVLFLLIWLKGLKISLVFCLVKFLFVLIIENFSIILVFLSLIFLGIMILYWLKIFFWLVNLIVLLMILSRIWWIWILFFLIYVGMFFFII